MFNKFLTTACLLNTYFLTVISLPARYMTLCFESLVSLV